jgi:hypothetical protein
MAGFNSDVFKASVLAVVTAILLGAATYVLSPQIETAPRLVATIDAYTERGGYGPSIVSSFYPYNENVSIFAKVKDTANKPVAHATVTFDVHGPPGSNITLPPQTAETNSSGVAVANITAPYQIAQPATVLGIWTAVATTEIADTQIVDSFVFEVKAPPSARDTRFIDVYTNRGGNGPNTSSQSYLRNETVNIYARVSNGTNPVEGSSVVFAAYWPTDELILLTSPHSNASGIATQTFRIPQVAESIGEWRVVVTVRINDQVFIDALTFECKP